MLKNNLFLEELIQFDARELSITRLIFFKYRKRWLITLSLLFIAIGLLFYLSLILNFYLVKAMCLILMPFFLLMAMAYSKKKTLIILRHYIIQYRLMGSNIWPRRASIIREIQTKKFIRFLSDYPNINSNKIRFIIESLRFENSIPRYKYQFFNVFSTLFSVIAGAFLAAVIAIPELLTSWQSIVVFFKPIIWFALMFVLFTWFFETMLLKDIVKLSANRYGRLLRILENYYLNVC